MERESSYNKEKEPKQTGVLLVITGKTGAGKDYVFRKALENEQMNEHGFSRVVTCASRPPRDEEEGVDYYFISEEEIFTMHKNNELVEEPMKYGSSYKATPKEELLKILDGENKIWRCDPNMGGKVASGEFFEELDLDKEYLLARTVVVFINADQETIEVRRKARDADQYDPNEYIERDEYDREVFDKYSDHFTNVIENPDGENDSLYKIINLVKEKLD